ITRWNADNSSGNAVFFRYVFIPRHTDPTGRFDWSCALHSNCVPFPGALGLSFFTLILGPCLFKVSGIILASRRYHGKSASRGSPPIPSLPRKISQRLFTAPPPLRCPCPGWLWSTVFEVSSPDSYRGTVINLSGEKTCSTISLMGSSSMLIAILSPTQTFQELAFESRYISRLCFRSLPASENAQRRTQS